MDDQELFRRREEILQQLAQHKENIERIAATGVPLLHLDTELVSNCLHFVLGEIALGNARIEAVEGVTSSPQYDTGEYPNLSQEDGESLHMDADSSDDFYGDPEVTLRYDDGTLQGDTTLPYKYDDEPFDETT